MNARSASNRRRSTSVYADLGNRASESMLVKPQLFSRIAELLAQRGMTQTEAATLLGKGGSNMPSWARNSGFVAKC
jgi:predicted XRE-type DNA-binding protein